MLTVTDAFVAPLIVCAYPPALMLKPELFTVQVTFVWAVFRPIASVEARAVVIEAEMLLSRSAVSSKRLIARHKIQRVKSKTEP